MRGLKPCPVCTKTHPYSPEEAIQSQAATYRKLETAIKGLTRKQLNLRPAEGKWSVREIVTHLADTEIVFGLRYRKILAEEEPELPAFDQELWASSLNYDQRDFNSVLEMFRALRRNNLNLLKLRSAKDWQRIGHHPVYGPLTLGELVNHIVAHDLNHLAQIRRIRKMVLGGRRERSAQKRSA